MRTDDASGEPTAIRPLGARNEPEAIFESVRRPGAANLFFDGRGGHDGAWPTRIGLRPHRLLRAGNATDADAALNALDGILARRRARGGPGGTGVVLVLAYEALMTRAGVPAPAWTFLALGVDASIGCGGDGEPQVVGSEEVVSETVRACAAPKTHERRERTTARAAGRPRTSLPKEAYLRAVTRVKAHIALGDIYQANLTQIFHAPFDGDPWDLYRALARATPAPRSAFLEAEGVALASVSPEVFVDVDASGRAETRPIKGTRPRGPTPSADAAAAAELLASSKDRAELVMIVDLERNDLGRIANVGGVRVPELLALRSYPAVHHLVARVEADLRVGVTPSELVRSVFPGGSITGAPKERAIELLASIEPCSRGLYTGSLFWFDDDGRTLSSILIRSAVVHDGRVSLGAGGGVVADSEPEAEWMEANAKARSLTRTLGFEPEEAS